LHLFGKTSSRHIQREIVRRAGAGLGVLRSKGWGWSWCSMGDAERLGQDVISGIVIVGSTLRLDCGAAVLCGRRRVKSAVADDGRQQA